MYLLDTNVCIHILNGTSAAVVKRFAQESPGTIRLCSIVKAELLFGARKSQRVADVLRNLKTFFTPLASVVFDDQCAEHYGMIRADLSRAGTPIGPNDLLIAAIARAHDMVVATHNSNEFSRVVGLRVEDWEA